MSLCFLVGTSKNKQNVKVPLIVEYLSFDDKKKNVDITSDIYVENHNIHDIQMECLHRGNIKFKVSKKWFNDKKYTKLFTEYIAPKIGHHLDKKDKKVWLGDYKEELRDFWFISGDDIELKNDITNNIPDENIWVPYVKFKLPILKGNSNSFYRVTGKLLKDSYNRFVNVDYPDSVSICGGEKLVNKIRNEISPNLTNYIGNFENFVNSRNIYSDSYFLFIEEKNKRDINFYNLSYKTNIGKENLRYKNRNISWYWYNDHNKYFKSYDDLDNGPMVKVSFSHH